MTNSMIPLLEVSDLTIEYQPRRRRQRRTVAVDAVSFRIPAGKTLGVVGESGSGKSTIGRGILGLVDVTHGRIRFDGRDIAHATRAERRSLAQSIGVVFQDPYGSLNPDHRIGYSLEEPLTTKGRLAPAPRRAAVAAMLERVSMPSDSAHRYPSEFSGGQRQRIAIARALMLSPRLVVCDEPVSALDLSVQAQVLNLLLELQDEQKLAYLFISHDLAVVRHMSHEILVLYKGQVMEAGLAATVVDQPRHPYTRVLLEAELPADPKARRRRQLGVRRQESASDLGCVFAQRCPHVVAVCRQHRPPLERQANGAWVACHRASELA